MMQIVVRYGLIAGLVAGAGLSGAVFLMNDHGSSSMLVGYLIMLVALSAVFVGIKRHRDQNLGGVIRFWPAFGTGLAISFVAGILYALAWEATMAATHMDFAGSYAKAMIEKEKAKGVTGDALAKIVADMESFKVMYANPLFRLPMTFAEIFPIGILVSLISAGLLRNSRFMAAQKGS